MKTIIERGASWTLEETKLLLALWGQDLVARQATCLKRTKEVYEKISEKFNEEGFERTPDQVRTRVFNMIAEYRRILKDPNPERMKKCIFFEALHKIYQARHLSDVKSAIDDYEVFNPHSPVGSGSQTPPPMIVEPPTDDETTEDNTSSMPPVDGKNNVSSNNTSNSNTNNTNTTATANNTNSSTASSSSNNNTTTANKVSGDNLANSINDTNSVKKTPGSKEGQTSAKRQKLDSPKPGTSQGDNNPENSDSKLGIKAGSSSSSSSSSNAAQGGSSVATSTHNASKQQSLLVSASITPSTSSTTSTPINNRQGGNSSASFININPNTKIPIIRTEQPQQARLPTTAAIASHQLYQAPVNTFDVTSSALLIDRMFAHLSKESENMREWIALEKERIALERTRRSQEVEREVRRERVLIDTLMKFHEQWISFVARLDPRVMEGAAGPLPELNIPKEILETQQNNGSNKANTSTSTASPVATTAATTSTATTTSSPVATTVPPTRTY